MTVTGGSTFGHERGADVQLGSRLSRYRIEERIGAGAGGTVFAASDPELGRSVRRRHRRAQAEIVGVEGDPLVEQVDRRIRKLEHRR